VIRVEHLRHWGSGRDFWRRFTSGRAWYWRPASILMLGVITGVLLAFPPAGATGAHRTSAEQPVRPTLNVVVVGDLFSYGYARSADPALRLSVPPTLAALNQVQLANQDVQLHVLFIPVWDATWNNLYKSSGSGKPPLINAVKDANVVIAGVGADVPSFAASLQAILFGTRVSAKMYPPMMGIFDNGSYQQEETAFLEDIAARQATGGVLVTLGYPLVQQVRLPSGRIWWSALSWSAIGGQQARLTNRLVSVLNTDNAAAARAAGTQYQAMHLLYADLSAMPSEAGARGAQATAGKETLIGNTLLPYVAQAVNDELTSKGVRGSASFSPITPTSRWDLSVQMPTGTQVPLPHSSSGSGRRPAAANRAAPSGQHLTNTQASPGNGSHKPVTIVVPMIPAPPAPLPKPIAPLALPTAVGSGGTPTGAGNTSAANTSSGASPPGSGTTSPSAGATTSPGGSSSPSSTTAPGGGTSPSGGTTTPSAGPTSPSAGGTSSFGGGTSSGGGSTS
jgi:hypothetical protein